MSLSIEGSMFLFYPKGAQSLLGIMTFICEIVNEEAIRFFPSLPFQIRAVQKAKKGMG